MDSLWSLGRWKRRRKAGTGTWSASIRWARVNCHPSTRFCSSNWWNRQRLLLHNQQSADGWEGALGKHDGDWQTRPREERLGSLSGLVCTGEFSSLLQIPPIANTNAAAQLLGMLGVIIYEFSSCQPFAALCQLTFLGAGLTDTVLKTAAGAESCLYWGSHCCEPWCSCSGISPRGIILVTVLQPKNSLKMQHSHLLGQNTLLLHLNSYAPRLSPSIMRFFLQSFQSRRYFLYSCMKYSVDFISANWRSCHLCRTASAH